jgi:hypothetical protein
MDYTQSYIYDALGELEGERMVEVAERQSEGRNGYSISSPKTDAFCWTPSTNSIRDDVILPPGSVL